MTQRFAVVVDACVLCSTLKRHLLLSLAHAQLCSVHWSEQILDETDRAIAIILRNKGRSDASERAAQTTQLLRCALPEANITVHERLARSIGNLPDDGDRHVIAAAITSRSEVIVTENLRDFPRKTLALYGIEPLSSDAFIVDLIESAPQLALNAINDMRERFARPDIDMRMLLATLRKIGLTQSAKLLEAIQGTGSASH